MPFDIVAMKCVTASFDSCVYRKSLINKQHSRRRTLHHNSCSSCNQNLFSSLSSSERKINNPCSCANDPSLYSYHTTRKAKETIPIFIELTPEFVHHVNPPIDRNHVINGRCVCVSFTRVHSRSVLWRSR